MGRNVKFAGQSITVGLCWSANDNCGALNELATGFNVWKYFRNHGNFSESEEYHLFKDSSNNVLLAIGYVTISTGTVRLYYKFAELDGNGDPIYVSSSIDYTGMLELGQWIDLPVGEHYNFSTSSVTDEDNYRASLYFYDFDSSMNALDYYQTAPAYAIGSMNVFNGYSYAIYIEPLEDVQTNIGMIYPENSSTIIPDIDSPTYPQNGGHYSHWFLPDLLANTEVEIISGYEDDNSGTGGGGSGYYGYGGIECGFWDLPGLSVLDTGFIRMYNPTSAELRALGSFMWSSSFVDNILKMFEDPIDAIIQLGIVPLDLSAIQGSSVGIRLGNVATGVAAHELTTEFSYVDLGKCRVPENWGNALDYAPFTEVQIFLPFVGFVKLNANEIMDSTISLRYYFDLLSGDCVAALKIDKVSKNNVALHSVMYSYKGNLMLTIPFTGKNYSDFYGSIITTAVGAGLAGMSGGAASAVMSGISGATGLMNSTPSMERSGSWTGAAAFIGDYKPYIAITRPIQHKAEHYSGYVGYPTFITYVLETLSGYTVVESVIDNTVAATEKEKEEIERLLKEGVIL